MKQRTVGDYERLLKHDVLPTFGGMAVAAITPRLCEEFLTNLVARPSRQNCGEQLSPASVKHVWTVLRRVLKCAVQHGALDANPCDRVDFQTNRATGDRESFEHHPLTAAQVGALSAAVAGEVGDLPAYPIYALMVEFLAYSGLRAAENTGLEVGDLEFTTGPGQTRCTVHVTRTKERRNKEWQVGTTKSKKSRRSVPLPPWLAAKLWTYLAEVHPNAADLTAPLWPSRKNGGGFRAKGARYAVPHDWTQPLAMGTFYDTIMKPALVAVGLPASAPATRHRPAQRGVRLHDLRHTFATMQLSAGMHFMQVSKWLGHSTFTLTLDTYGDWVPTEDGGALNNLPAPTYAATADVQPANVTPLFGG